MDASVETEEMLLQVGLLGLDLNDSGLCSSVFLLLLIKLTLQINFRTIRNKVNVD